MKEQRPGESQSATSISRRHHPADRVFFSDSDIQLKRERGIAEHRDFESALAGHITPELASRRRFGFIAMVVISLFAIVFLLVII